MIGELVIGKLVSVVFAPCSLLFVLLKKMKKFHKIVSFVLQPLFMPVFGMILLVSMELFSVFTFGWKLNAVLVTFVFTALAPAVPILLLMSRGKIRDLFISKREERTIPYLLSFISYLFWTLFLWKILGFPLSLVAMGIGASISILIITIINLKWKISAHMSGIGGLAGGIFGICYRMAINPVWLFVIILSLSALVALSRIELKAHTPGQTLAGFSVGFASVFFSVILV